MSETTLLESVLSWVYIVYAVNGADEGGQDGETHGQCYTDILPDVDAFLRVYTYTQNIRGTYQDF